MCDQSKKLKWNFLHKKIKVESNI